MTSPVYTILNQCQDCYKCVRHCPVKAIRIVNGNASVISEACVACGECVKVCPVGAKKIRSDLARLRTLLDSGEKLYASVAPSFTGYFPGVSIEQLAGALKAIGFAGVSETAHGAQVVSTRVSSLLAVDAPPPVMISSACPACVDYIRRYAPAWAPYIAPVPSPVRAHVGLLRERLDPTAKVVFIGPCAAKKNESDAHGDELLLAVTFASLERLLEEQGVILRQVAPSALALGPAAEGRFYSIEGGMNDTLRDGGDRIRYVSVSGLENLRQLLAVPPPASDGGGRPIFIEALACPGGCVNGPAMKDRCSLATLLATDAQAPIRPSRTAETCAAVDYPAAAAAVCRHAEADIAAALARVGKTSKAAEVNCGACGYESCRAFAEALLDGKAEVEMCHTYLKQNFQRTSNALIRYIPAAVVIVGPGGTVLECNRHFADLVGVGVAFEALGTIEGMSISDLLPEFAGLFAGALEHGSEIEKFRQPLGKRLVNVSVFSITQGESAGAVIQDVSRNEMQREQVAAKAREVIRQNVRTVQEVARLFGEHIAETEIMLNEIAGTYESKTVGVSYNGGDSESYLNG